MKFESLVRKLFLGADRFVSDSEIKDYCKTIGLTYAAAMSYLIKYKYVKRIVRGFFYVPSIEERKLKTTGVNHLEAISRAMDYKKVSNWYFGFDTAIKLNKLTHEYFVVDYVVSDKIFRPMPITILGHGVKFVRLNGKLFGFGTKKEGRLIYSDVEKTILDIVHVGKYNGKTDSKIKDEITDLLKCASKNKLMRYSAKYSKSVRKFLEDGL